MTDAREAPDLHSASLQIPGDHPSLAGHFPGRPVVPAVVILGAVLDLAEERLVGHSQVTRIMHAKFTRPLLPDECASIELQAGGDVLRFLVKAGGALVASGALGLSSGDGT